MDMQVKKALIEFKDLYSKFKLEYDNMHDIWGDDFPLTVLSSNYAKIVVESWINISNEKLLKIFEYVETLLNKDSEKLKDIICTGFLERLMHEVSEGKIEYIHLLNYLGSESKKYCDAYNSFTI